MSANLLFLIDELNGWGGSEKQLFELVSRLDRSKFRPYIGILQRDTIADAFRRAQTPVYSLQLGKLTPRSVWRLAGDLQRLVQREAIAGIVAYHNTAEVFGAATAALCGLPFAICRRDMGFLQKPWQKLLLKSLQPWITQEIAVCEAALRQRIEQEGAETDDTRVIYNGVDLQHYSPDGDNARAEFDIADDEVVVVVLANFHPIKGHEIVLAAAKHLVARTPKLRLLFVGAPRRDGFFDRVQEEAISRGLARHLICTGARSDVSRLLRTADIMVLVSETEGCSNAILQGMATGLPIIASAVGGNPELVTAENGVLVPARSVEALTTALQQLVEDVSLRKRLGAASRQRACEKFSTPQMLQMYEESFADLIAKSPKRVLQRNLKAAGYLASRPLLSPLRRVISGARDAILAYHRVSNERGCYDSALVISPKRLQSQLETLARSYEIVPLSTLVQSSARRPRVALTFDDGYADLVDEVMPLCIRKGWPATAFVCTAPLSGETLWHDELGSYLQQEPKLAHVASRFLQKAGIPCLLREELSASQVARNIVCLVKDLPTEEAEALLQLLRGLASNAPSTPKYLNSVQLQQLYAAGMEIGAHSVRHPILTRCSDERLAEELTTSKQLLESTLKTSVVGLAYPAGYVDNRVALAAREAGYLYACTTQPVLGDDKMRLGRVCLSGENGEGVWQALQQGMVLAAVERSST